MMLKWYHTSGRMEAGCDEAGRGCLAGPVFAAAVILPAKRVIKGLDDSKKLTEAKRNALRERILDKALGWAVAKVDPAEIDEINILQASFRAMHAAVDALKLQADHLLIDGNRFNEHPTIPHTCVIKGDGKYASIAAASILAKTFRDDFMAGLDREFPEYGWARNKGYPTREHKLAIREHGTTPHHRMTFNFEIG